MRTRRPVARTAFSRPQCPFRHSAHPDPRLTATFRIATSLHSHDLTAQSPRARTLRTTLRETARIIREHDLYTAILLASRGSGVGSHRKRLAETFGFITVGRYTSLAQCIGHRLCP